LLTSSEFGNDAAICCNGISKRYQIGRQKSYRTLRDSIMEAVQAPFHRAGSNRRASKSSTAGPELWALKDVSFRVRHGEVLGVIGRNGSGKSTLLKIISGITRPTKGKAGIRGRIGTLLEVGAGFHPELTGRENIQLNGAILGMTRREIARKFDEIVDFSECSQMLDTPIKHYSSGMYVRLAFAVAAHLETEILLVDEVLAVGDTVFQKKCLGKIGDVTHQGRTVLFVSHNLLVVDALCTRAICLHEGKIVLEGRPSEVTSRYLKNWLPTFREVVHRDFQTAPGVDQIRLRRACVRPMHGSVSDDISVSTPIVVEFEYWKVNPNECIDLDVAVLNEHGVLVFCTACIGSPAAPAGLLRGAFTIPADLMNSGTYQIRLSALLNGATVIAQWDDQLTFEVQDAPGGARGTYLDEWPGAVRPNLPWTRELLESLPESLQSENRGS
jgi:lipopolysaccharide transport system ATP-binding protein